MSRKASGRTIMGMSLVNILIMVLSILQAIIVARAFGTSRTYDIYLVALILPQVFVFLATELINATLLPAFNERLSSGDEKGGWNLAFSSLNGMILFGVIFTILLEFLAPLLVKVLAPGFNAQEQMTTVLLLRLLLPVLGISLIYKVLLTLHHTIESFIIPIFGGLIPPAVISLSVYLFTDEIGINSLIYGIIIGVVLQILTLIPLLVKHGGKWWHPTIKFKDPALRSMLILSLGFLVGAVAERANLLVDRAVASFLSTGKISALKYGFQMVTYAQAFFSIPLNKVYYTHLAQDIAQTHFKLAGERFIKGIKLLVVFYIPVMSALAIFSLPVIRVFLERGEFTLHSSIMTSQSLTYYAPSLLFIGIISLTSSLMYVLKEVRIFSIIGGLIIALNLLLDILLLKWFDYLGIALTTVIVSVIWSVTFIYYLWNKMQVPLLNLEVLKTALKSIVASSIALFSVWLLMPDYWNKPIQGVKPGLVHFVLLVLLGAVIYFGLLYILKERSFLSLFKKDDGGEIILEDLTNQ